MPLRELLPVDSATAQWPVWGTTARLVVTDPDRLQAARQLVVDRLAAVDRACSRFRSDSEVRRVQRAAGRPVRVSPLLADLVTASLRAAERTGGDVDPTLGGAMQRLGYDRDFTFVLDGGRLTVREEPAPGWRRVRLVGRDLTVPDETACRLDRMRWPRAVCRVAARVAYPGRVGVPAVSRRHTGARRGAGVGRPCPPRGCSMPPASAAVTPLIVTISRKLLPQRASEATTSGKL